MNREKIEEAFAKLVDEGLEGFTLSLDGDLHNPEKGYAVATGVFDSVEDAINNVGAHQFIGFWKDTMTHRVFIEIVDIFESSITAFAVALRRNQKAIYDFMDDKVLFLKGFYDAGSNPED